MKKFYFFTVLCLIFVCGAFQSCSETHQDDTATLYDQVKGIDKDKVQRPGGGS